MSDDESNQKFGLTFEEEQRMKYEKEDNNFFKDISNIREKEGSWKSNFNIFLLKYFKGDYSKYDKIEEIKNLLNLNPYGIILSRQIYNKQTIIDQEELNSLNLEDYDINNKKISDIINIESVIRYAYIWHTILK